MIERMSFTDYCYELVQIYKIRHGMTGDEARRYILDMASEVKEAYEDYTSPKEYVDEEVASWDY